MTPATEEGIKHYQAKRYAEAFTCFHSAAEAGDDYACLYLYFSYRLAQGTTFNRQESDACLKRIAENQEVMIWIKQQADAGDSKAQNTLGHLHIHPIKLDYSTAFSWLLKAATQGEPIAQSCVGFFYNDGHTIDRDILQAIFWYRKAAAQDYVATQENLANIYFSVFGYIDHGKAWFWQQKAKTNDDRALLKYCSDISKADALISEAIAWHGSTYLDLSNFGLDYGIFDAVSVKLVNSTKLTNSTLKVLNLSDNNLGDRALSSLIKFLKVFPALTELNLSKNKFSANAIEKLTELISQHNTLSKINLAGNPYLETIHLAIMASRLQSNLELEKQFQQIKKSIVNISQISDIDPDQAEELYLNAITSTKSLVERKYFPAHQLLTTIKFQLGRMYAKYDLLALAVKSLADIIDAPRAATILAESIFRTKQLPFTDPFDKYRLILLLLRDDQSNSALTKRLRNLLLRQTIYALQQRSIEVMTSADLNELIGADILISYKQLRDILKLSYANLEDRLDHIINRTTAANNVLTNHLYSLPETSVILNKTLAILNLCKEEQIVPLQQSMAALKNLIEQSEHYTDRGFALLLENDTVKSTLQNQFSTTSVQVFEKFLALSPEQQADNYKQQLLNQLTTWARQVIKTKKRLILEAQEAEHAEIARLAQLVNSLDEESIAKNIVSKNQYELEVRHRQPAGEENTIALPILSLAANQPSSSSYPIAEQPKPSKPNVNWAKILTINSVLLFLGGGVATGLFFIGLPLWAVITAGIGTFVLSSLITTSYTYLRQHYAAASDKPFPILDQAPINHSAGLPILPSVTIHVEPISTNNQLPITPSQNSATNNLILA